MTDAYGEMQRLSLLLLAKLGGDITITERELVEVAMAGKAIRISEDPVSGSVRVRIVDEPTGEHAPASTEASGPALALSGVRRLAPDWSRGKRPA